MENIALTLENVTGKGLGFKLKDISAKFENGYIYAITGKNGAGKTTLFNYILAQRKRYTGSIKMSGYELERNHAKAMEIIGFVSEDNVFFENRTGKQNADILGLVYDDFDVELFNECMKYAHNDTVFVFEGIKASRKMRELWEEICACPEVTVTLDLYSLGIVLFNKKLHKRDYIVYF